jgi:steroid delta-isomerase-like uncharacterized protein
VAKTVFQAGYGGSIPLTRSTAADASARVSAFEVPGVLRLPRLALIPRSRRRTVCDFLNHEAPENRGPEGFKATARWLRTAFPDLHAVVHETVAEGDLVVGRITLSGTHQGDYMGVPATGRSFSVQHMHMYRVADGKLAEHWACRDDLGQLAQLGLTLPASA